MMSLSNHTHSLSPFSSTHSPRSNSSKTKPFPPAKPIPVAHHRTKINGTGFVPPHVKAGKTRASPPFVHSQAEAFGERDVRALARRRRRAGEEKTER
ncbi:unnamed protein product [Linum trigynum]|uniref:Uncharacterized protein n=1 Tax=Linum trigynum TaxID=586398 RepID=A0AAV2CER1_9ROSI